MDSNPKTPSRTLAPSQFSVVWSVFVWHHPLSLCRLTLELLSQLFVYPLWRVLGQLPESHHPGLVRPAIWIVCLYQWGWCSCSHPSSGDGAQLPPFCLLLCLLLFQTLGHLRPQRKSLESPSHQVSMYRMYTRWSCVVQWCFELASHGRKFGILQSTSSVC